MNKIELKACPACGGERPSYESTAEETNHRCDNHYREYVCSCGFHGGKAFYNCHWDEVKCEVEARQIWNDSVSEALSTRPPALGELSDNDLFALFDVMDTAWVCATSPAEGRKDVAKAARQFLGKVDG